jgi:hypothetical protein
LAIIAARPKNATAPMLTAIIGAAFIESPLDGSLVRPVWVE